MFERSLEEKFQRIFDLKWVRFGFPSDVHEQETLFIEISLARNTIKDNRQIAKVTGKGRMFAQLEKLKYGYFAKKIKEADVSLTRDLFFYDIEENKTYFRDLTERSFSFIYLFDGQYDPDNGTISSLIFNSEGDGE